MNEREFSEKLDGILAGKNGDLWLVFLEGEIGPESLISALDQSNASAEELDFALTLAKADASISSAATAIANELNLELPPQIIAARTAREIAEAIIGKRRRTFALDENTFTGLICGIMCVSLIALGGFFQSSAFSYSATACAAVYAGLVFFKRQTVTGVLRQL